MRAPLDEGSLAIWCTLPRMFGTGPFDVCCTEQEQKLDRTARMPQLRVRIFSHGENTFSWNSRPVDEMVLADLFDAGLEESDFCATDAADCRRKLRNRVEHDEACIGG